MQTTYAHASDEPTTLEPKGRAVARAIAAEGIVLLENNGTLPLDPCRIALFGTGAEMTVTGGTGSGEVNVRHSVSVREGLEAAGFEIATALRLDAYRQKWHACRTQFIADQRAKMRKPSPRVLGELIAMEFRHPADDPVTTLEAEALQTDTCVYVIARQSGEGVDRTDEAGSFRLTEQELADLRVCAHSFSNTIVVLNVGAPIDLSFRHDIDGIDAIVLMGQAGMEGGHALADILTGVVCPSGKLAVTWPEGYAQVPFGSSFGTATHDNARATYAEGIFVGYRYYTSFDVTPAYPFGYGLSYTSFTNTLSSIELAGTNVVAHIDVRNTGDAYTGKHVVQMYAHCPDGTLAKETHRLIGFAKTRTLTPGSSETVSIRIPLDAFASYDEQQAQTVLEPGNYDIMLGSSAHEVETVARLTLATRIVLEQHRNLCASAQPVCTLVKPNRPHGEAAGQQTIPVIAIDPTSIETVTHTYGKTSKTYEELEQLVNALSSSQMVSLCVGTGLLGNKDGFSVPGAVGHTTTKLRNLGIPNIELCDGPAGIRLQRRSAVDAKGAIKPIDPPLSLYEVLPPLITGHLYGDAEHDKIVYQFVTGFPTASMLAQTWNTELARHMGETVGSEMAAYGVTYWLAPALNIVRNPLCGRNFEYFSEDPLISGKMAAFVTRGVQQTPGCYACLKHFAANNQETNRNFVSSEIDERALREIYLRGFEIAVRESNPASIMSAYNRINGVYCSESAELLTNVLRDEWGFSGVVMTDWLATGRGRSNECRALEAGVDLIMPGGNSAHIILAIGLLTGKLSRRALKRACTHVLEKALAARPNLAKSITRHHE